MKLSTRLLGKSYRFRSIKELLARANEARSGDELAGIAARSEQERIAAKTVLADLTLNDLRENPVVAYDRDEVTRVIDDALDRDAFAGRARARPSASFANGCSTTTTDRRRDPRGRPRNHRARLPPRSPSCAPIST